MPHNILLILTGAAGTASISACCTPGSASPPTRTPAGPGPEIATSPDARRSTRPCSRPGLADGGYSWSPPQRIHVDGKLISGIYPRALILENSVLAVLRCQPDGSVIFSPDGRGAHWSDEVMYDRPGMQDGWHAGMQDMALIGLNTVLVIDIIHNGNGKGWRGGLPMTVAVKK